MLLSQARAQTRSWLTSAIATDKFVVAAAAAAAAAYSQTANEENSSVVVEPSRQRRKCHGARPLSRLRLSYFFHLVFYCVLSSVFDKFYQSLRAVEEGSANRAICVPTFDCLQKLWKTCDLAAENFVSRELKLNHQKERESI